MDVLIPIYNALIGTGVSPVLALLLLAMLGVLVWVVRANAGLWENAKEIRAELRSDLDATRKELTRVETLEDGYLSAIEGLRAYKQRCQTSCDRAERIHAQTIHKWGPRG